MTETHASASWPRDLLGIAFRHWKKIGAFCALTFGVAVGIIVFYPRTYVSEAKLYVRIGRENATLDPTATTGETLAIRIDQQNEINSLLDILECRGMAERVVDVVGVERILANGSSNRKEAASSAFSPTHLLDSFRASLKRLKALVSDPISDREIAVSSVEQMTEVRAPKESTVITIVCKAGSTDLAQQTTSAMTEVFLKEHLRLSRTKGTHQFFAKQSKQLHEQLKEASEELGARKSEFGLLTVEGKRLIVEEELKTVKLEILGTQRGLSASQARVRSLQEQLALLSPEVTETMTGVSHAAWDSMRESLYELEIRESAMRSKYTDEHPELRAIAEQRREVSQILEGQPQERTHATRILNPTYQILEAELLREGADVVSLQARKELLGRQYTEVLEELESLNDQDLQITELQRHVELLEANYRIHAEKLEQARIDEALETQRISSINIVQPATFVGKPVSPKKRLALLLAIVVSVFGGLGIALVSENLDQTLHTPEEAEAALDLPVLVSIPRTRRHRFVMN
jgi:uncharacterized protein involved in exopolysaccharide biosynthesis